ncbi:hypothetical protein BZL30_9419 [Mycobacterium kansasii]|uniref:Maltokinase N-terminal cap domain-containing protein n=1 Tax=Mycobacterium kansasii TaxID=1768 RepID=A0A1V3W9G5_MYCKA|nr:hypothetical protein BZL30_9419 [Mycobacterium kansasii]
MLVDADYADGSAERYQVIVGGRRAGVRVQHRATIGSAQDRMGFDALYDTMRRVSASLIDSSAAALLAAWR